MTVVPIPLIEIKPVELFTVATERSELLKTIGFDGTVELAKYVKSESIVLFETLEKVRVDKDYIPQANAICNVVSQMINVQKIEMQLKKR